jgi:hypothetical protein
MSLLQPRGLKLPVARCNSCSGGDYCARCRETNIEQLRRRWRTADSQHDVHKDVFEKLFVLRYGRDAMNSAMYHKYYTNFSLSMTWHRESLGKYIDAICEGNLENMSLASTFVPDDSFAQLSNEEILDRCGELTRHLQSLHAELTRRKQQQVPDNGTAVNLAGNVIPDPGTRHVHDTVTTSRQVPAFPRVKPSDITPSDSRQLRLKILQYWTENGDPRAFKFVRMPLHTPRFLAIILDLARHYSWEQTTRMINCVIIERVRHFQNSDDKDRYPKLDDWQKVLDICSSQGFPSFEPDELTPDDLAPINFRMTDRGLVKEGNSFSPYADRLGICTQRGPLCVKLSTGIHVFARDYILRCEHASREKPQPAAAGKS